MSTDYPNSIPSDSPDATNWAKVQAMKAWDKDRFPTDRVIGPGTVPPPWHAKVDPGPEWTIDDWQMHKLKADQEHAAAAAAEHERYAPTNRSSTMPEMEGLERHANDVQLLVADLLTENDHLRLRIADLEGYIYHLTTIAHDGLKTIEGQVNQARAEINARAEMKASRP